MEIKDSGERKTYTHRHIGDVVGDGAILVSRINGQKWKIKCKCGKTFIGQPSNTSGLCWNCSHKKVAQEKVKHNESPKPDKKASRLYRIWLGMKARCNIPTASGYEYYGKCGIKACSEWDNYLNFKNWSLSNGYAENLTLDRINGSKNYSPDNCRWVNKTTQGRNKRNNHLLTYKGETKSMAEWSEVTGIKYHTLKRRINNLGWSVERALECKNLISMKEGNEE